MCLVRCVDSAPASCSICASRYPDGSIGAAPRSWPSEALFKRNLRLRHEFQNAMCPVVGQPGLCQSVTSGGAARTTEHVGSAAWWAVEGACDTLAQALLLARERLSRKPDSAVEALDGAVRFPSPLGGRSDGARGHGLTARSSRSCASTGSGSGLAGPGTSSRGRSSRTGDRSARPSGRTTAARSSSPGRS